MEYTDLLSGNQVKFLAFMRLPLGSRRRRGGAAMVLKRGPGRPVRKARRQAIMLTSRFQRFFPDR